MDNTKVDVLLWETNLNACMNFLTDMIIKYGNEINIEDNEIENEKVIKL